MSMKDELVGKKICITYHLPGSSVERTVIGFFREIISFSEHSVFIILSEGGTDVLINLNYVLEWIIDDAPDEESKKERKITLPMAEHLGKTLQAPYFEVFLDTGENIGLVFQTIAEMIYKRLLL